MSSSLDDIERGQRVITQQTRDSAKRNADEYKTGNSEILEFFFALVKMPVSITKVQLSVIRFLKFY
jgi:hypothetical protein